MRWFSLFPILTLLACHDEPSGPNVAGVNISIAEVSCTEVWLRLRTNASPIDRRVEVWRDGALFKQLNIASSDTVLLDDGLLPNHSYLYHAVGSLLNATKVTSEPVLATTLDTTRQDFGWGVTRLGEGSSSVLHDVAIINDTLAYAVGEIYRLDSLGQWEPLPYNLARWDGQQWHLDRVTVVFRGSAVTVTLDGIFAYSATNIWLAGSIPIHGDGFAWQGYDIQNLVDPGATVSRMWGSPTDMYFVGRGGNIIRLADGIWKKVESGTDQNIQDVQGIIDYQRSAQTVLCVASHPLGYGDKKILSLSQNSVDTVSWPPQRVVMSVWLSKASMVYTCGGGVFRRGPDQHWKEIAGADVIPSLTERVRGTADNDIFVVGDFGVVAHFNGVSFRVYPEARVALVYTSVAVKGNTVIAVGYASSGAVILQGRRH